MKKLLILFIGSIQILNCTAAFIGPGSSAATGGITNIVVNTTNANFRDTSIGTTNGGGVGTWFGWASISNGGLTIPAFDTGLTPSASAAGITFLLPNGNLAGRISVWGNHGGTNVPEMLVDGGDSLQLRPAGNGNFGTLVFGKTSGSDIIYLQYAQPDSTITAGYSDNITTYPFSHSQPLGFAAGTTNAAVGAGTSIPGIMGISGTNQSFGSARSGDYFDGELWFFTHIPEVVAVSPLTYNSFKVMGKMRTNGWTFRGNTALERTLGVATNTIPLDFALGDAVDLSIDSASVTFYTTNANGFGTNFEQRTFIIRANGFNPTFTWPGWSVIGTNAAGTLLPSMAAGQMVVLKLLSVGLGESNKIAEAWLTTDKTYVFGTAMQEMMAAMGSTSPLLSNALDYLEISLRGNNNLNYNFWTNIDALYPFVGGTSNSMQINMRNTNSMKIAWTRPDLATFSTNGVKGDGVSFFGNTLTNTTAYTNAAYKPNYAHLFAYIETAPTLFITAFGGAFPDNDTSIDALNSSTFRALGPNEIAGGGPTINSFTISPIIGPAIAIRTNSTTIQGGIQNQFGSAINTSAGLPGAPLFVLARSDPGAVRLSDATLAGFSIGGGMTQPQWDEYRRIWDNFEAMVNRKVP